MAYPQLTIYYNRIKENASFLRTICQNQGIDVVAAIKGFNADPAICQALIDVGYTCFASSRLCQLQDIRNRNLSVQTMLLRIPMLSELAQLIYCTDITLISEKTTITELNNLLKKADLSLSVILMRDLGDLREGILDRNEFYELAEYTESLSHVHLLGIGTNLSCYGSVIPTVKNLQELSDDAVEIERRIGRILEVVSGGATSSLPLVFNRTMPAKINQLRIGEALIVPVATLESLECVVTPLRTDAILLHAEIIEIGIKPTMPIGDLGRNGLGGYSKYVDRGNRLRAILAIGVFDIGEPELLIPVDSDITVLGASSDHLIVDIQDSKQIYKLGDIISFKLCYKNMLFATSSQEIEKQVFYNE